MLHGIGVTLAVLGAIITIASIVMTVTAVGPEVDLSVAGPVLVVIGVGVIIYSRRSRRSRRGV